MTQSSDYAHRPCLPELILLLLTGVGHVTLELISDGLHGAAETLDRPQQYYNLAACVLWGGYILWRATHTPGLRQAWGIQVAQFRPALTWSLVFAVPASAFLIGYGFVNDRLPIPVTFWVVLFLYPLWGIAQQFALQSLITKNLRGAIKPLPARALAVAILFSIAHFPNYWLMALVFPAGLAFTWIFEKRPNLWAIGLTHGLLGSLAYYLVLGKDPGAELLGLLQRLN
jgi:membrane protease YdiL (CAAX protease family)